jgi:hypothetical protein
MKALAVRNGQSADMPYKDLLSFLKFMEDYKPEPLLIEAQLILQDKDKDEYLAMTIDLLAKVTITETSKEMVQDGVYQRGDKKGEPKMIEVKKETTKEVIILIDFKSNFFEKEKKTFYEGHLMQLLAAQMAVKQNFGIDVHSICNFASNAWRTTPSFTLFEHKETPEDLITFWAYWNLMVAKKINVPKGNILVCDNPKTSSDFKLISYQEYAESILLPQVVKV